MPKFPLETPNGSPSSNDRGLFADTSDRNIGKDESVSDIVKAGIPGLSTDDIQEGTVNKFCSDENISASPDVVLDTEQRHTHANKSILDEYDYLNSEFESLVSESHAHANKAFLDALAFGGDGSLILDNHGNWVTPPSVIGDASSAASVVLTSQTISGTPVAGDLLYIGTNGTWYKVVPGFNTPKGLYFGVPGSVAMMGSVEFPGGLTPGMAYFMGPSGAISTIGDGSNWVKIGFAKSATTFLVDIDVERSSNSLVGDNGYFVGGAMNTRIDTVSDTVSMLSANMGVNESGTSFSSSSYGYAIGSVSQKLSFTTMTFSTVPASFSLMSGTMKRGAFSSYANGYLSGGITANSNVIERIQFATDTVSTESATLSATSFENRATQSSLRGYIHHSYNGANLGTTTRFDFATSTSVAGPSIVARRKPATGFSNSSGYFFGGGVSTEIDGIRFDTESYINPAAALTSTGSPSESFSTIGSTYVPYSGGTNKFNHGSETVGAGPLIGNFGGVGMYPSAQVPDSLGFGYVVSGTTSGGTGSMISGGDKIAFSTDVVYPVLSFISRKRIGVSGVSGYYAGYFGGGLDSNNTYINEIDGLRYATETTLNPVSSLSVPRGHGYGMATQDYGYFAGGKVYANDLIPTSLTIDRISFSTDTVSTISASMNGSWAGASFSDQAYGHMCYGFATGVDYDQRLVFSNETVIDGALQLTSTIAHPGAFSASSGGFVGGGTSGGGLFSSVQRNNGDTWNYLLATLSQAKQSLSGNASQTNGYFSGGNTSLSGISLTSGIDKVNISNFSIGANSYSLSGNRDFNVGVQSIRHSGIFAPFYGYYSGGFNGNGTSPVYSNAIDKHTFGTITASTTSATLSVARSYTGTGNSSLAGYISGGYNTSLINKMIFSSETASALSAALLTARFQVFSANSNVALYNMGGCTISAGTYNTINGVTFSTDANRTVGFTLVASRGGGSVFGNSNYGYAYSGGRMFSNPLMEGTTAEIDGISYATDTLRNPSAAASYTLAGSASFNSDTKGYSMGGYLPSVGLSQYTSVRSFDFATETVLVMSNMVSGTTDGVQGTNSNAVGLRPGFGMTFATGTYFVPSALTVSANMAYCDGFQSGGFY